MPCSGFTSRYATLSVNETLFNANNNVCQFIADKYVTFRAKLQTPEAGGRRNDEEKHLSISLRSHPSTRGSSTYPLA